jgi:hypothetical protein
MILVIRVSPNKENDVFDNIGDSISLHQTHIGLCDIRSASYVQQLE